MKLTEHIYWSKGSCCTYLVDDGTAIDPGCDFDKVKDLVEASGIVPVRILATHAHPDHVGCLDTVASVYNARVFAKGGRSGWKEHLFSINLDFLIDQDIAGDMTFGDYKVISTPGHASDHVSFINRRLRTLFSGDAMQVKDGVLCCAPRTFNTDHEEAVESFGLLQSLSYELLCPGHREPIRRERLPIALEAYSSAPIPRAVFTPE